MRKPPTNIEKNGKADTDTDSEGESAGETGNESEDDGEDAAPAAYSFAFDTAATRLHSPQVAHTPVPSSRQTSPQATHGLLHIPQARAR